MKITDIEEGWLVEKMANIDFLRCFTPDQLKVLIQNMMPLVLLGNEPVIKEGQSGEDFFFIYNGRVSVWVEKNGQRTRLARLSRGDYFGEISLLTGKPASATVITGAPTKVFFANSKQFISLIKENELLSKHIIKTMQNRLHERKEAVETLGLGTAKDLSLTISEFIKAS